MNDLRDRVACVLCGWENCTVDKRPQISPTSSWRLCRDSLMYADRIVKWLKFTPVQIAYLNAHPDAKLAVLDVDQTLSEYDVCQCGEKRGDHGSVSTDHEFRLLFAARPPAGFCKVV